MSRRSCRLKDWVLSDFHVKRAWLSVRSQVRADFFHAIVLGVLEVIECPNYFISVAVGEESFEQILFVPESDFINHPLARVVPRTKDVVDVNVYARRKPGKNIQVFFEHIPLGS